MKKFVYILSVLTVSIILFNTGCSSDKPKNKLVVEVKPENFEENQALVKFLEQSGNFINSQKIPTLISAEDVKANLKRYLIIDLRRHDDYVNGHIDGAVNVNTEDLISYMKKNVAAGTYDKIVTVCYSGNRAAFSAMVLRLLGYANVYSMKWGMSSWDKKTAEKKWLKGISDKYASKLETVENPKLPKTKLPEIKTGKVLGYDILEARADSVLKRSKITVSIDKISENLFDFYIVNYCPEYNYRKGHFPGAVQYTPKQSLTYETELLTLPADKKIVVYCYTGQHADFVAAYLQILGYDAYSLAYGANSFMHSKLSSLKIGHAFTPEEIKNFPLVQGELPSLKNESVSDNGTEKETTPVPVIRKKPQKEEEGGC